MDSDYGTAFSQHFQDAVTVLRHDADYTKTANLSLGFQPERGLLTLSFWDGEFPVRNFYLESADFQQVDSFLRGMGALYGFSEVARFQSLSKEYLRQIDRSRGFSGQLRAPSECETCGYSDDELEAFYYPAIEEGSAPSLAVSNRYGCYGGAAIYGDPRDPAVSGEALRILRSALETAEGEQVRAELASFIEAVEAILQERSAA